ncbi:MAG: WD40 repeat domain-containing protein, partial [Cyanobacteria bacterium P01_H01_bin.130]
AYGRHVGVWNAADQNAADQNAADQSVVTTLNFDASSVLDLAWHPRGDRLSVSGNQVIKTWQRQGWDDDPIVLETGIASDAIAWSLDGHYFAAGNNDRSVMMWKGGDPHPWHMQGFPGKVRQLAWSMAATSLGSPMLASMSGQTVTVSTQSADPSTGWKTKPLDTHQRTVSAIAFQPNTLLLASAAEDGRLCLWHGGIHLAQTLEHQSTEFSCLAWSPSGKAIAAGGSQGELLLWAEIAPGKGFG